jgi:hypothetical protein
MEVCAYSQCGKQFEPSHSNQAYHSTRCRELAKREKHSLLRVHQDEVPSVKAFLARRRRLRSGVTPLPGTGAMAFPSGRIMAQESYGAAGRGNAMMQAAPTSTENLLASERRFLEAMRRMRFGRFECLQIRNGELVLDPWPTTIRDMKFGSQGGQQATTADEFALKQQAVELFEYVRSVAVGKIRILEIRHGLPFSMEITLDCTVDPEGARQSPAQAFGPRS